MRGRRVFRWIGCLNWCRHQLECGESGGDLVECLDTCGQGLQGREGLTFTAAEACFVQEGANAECQELGACLEASEPAALCSTTRQEQARCQLIEDEESCQAACLDALDQDDIDTTQCILAGIRDGAQCGVIAECIDYQPTYLKTVLVSVRRAQNVTQISTSFCTESVHLNPMVWL